jgi:hypothetical protein
VAEKRPCDCLGSRVELGTEIGRRNPAIDPGADFYAAGDPAGEIPAGPAELAEDRVAFTPTPRVSATTRESDLLLALGKSTAEPDPGVAAKTQDPGSEEKAVHLFTSWAVAPR